MARSFGAQAKVAGGLDQAGAEVVLPDAVDHDAGGERVIGRGDGSGQFEAAVALLERTAVGTGQHFEKAAWDFGPRLRRAAAAEHHGLWLRGAVDEHECGLDTEGDESSVDRTLELPEFDGDVGRVEELGVHHSGVGNGGGRGGVVEKAAEGLCVWIGQGDRGGRVGSTGLWVDRFCSLF